MFRFLRLSNFYKNLLIFTPIIVSNNLILFQDYNKIFTGLIIFFLITNLCYLINDYTDRYIDKINKLKKRFKILNLKDLSIYIFFYFIIIICTLIFLNQQKNYFIYLYFVNFLFYNFYFKKKRYLDLIFLTNFYLIRVFYGCQLFDLDINIGFILFLLLMFLSLSAYKRIIQISVNKIVHDSKIISYTIRDTNILKKMIFSLIFLNFIIFQLYIIFNLNLVDFNYLSFFYVDFNSNSLIFLDLIYILVIARVFYTLIKNTIKDDVYSFFIKDKFILCLAAILIIILIYEFFN